MKNKLIQLLRDNSAAPSAIRCQKAEKASDVAEVYLKGVISADFGVSASDLREAFNQAEGAPVSLFINSPGGDVFEGREMQGVIAGYKGKVTAVVQGVAASAATIVAMAADEVHMLKGSRYMIHNGWTITFGDRHAHQDTFKLLAGFDAELAAEYAKYTAKDVAELVAMMDAETWFTAEEALDQGFVHKLLENSKAAAVSAELRAWNLQAYANAPDLSALGDPDLLADPLPDPLPDYAAVRALNERRLRLLTLA